MFIYDNDFVDIIVYYKKIKNRYVAYTTSEFDKLGIKTDEGKAKYDKIEIKMKLLTWGLYNELQEQALVDIGDGERQFNFKVYKENRLLKLIKEWSAVKDGKPVPINEKSISMLAPSIAETILRSYDEISMIGEEEEGK